MLPFVLEFKKQVPAGRVTGLVPREAGAVRDLLKHRDELDIGPLDYTGSMEKVWLSEPLKEERLRVHEANYGPAALQRIIVADRQVGAGYVTGGLQPRTPLAHKAKTNNLTVPRKYVVELLDFVEAALTREAPDLVFCYSVAGAHGVAIAEASKRLGIPFTSLFPARLGSRYMVDDTVDGTSGRVLNECRRIMERGDVSNGKLETAKAYLNDSRIGSGPEYMEGQHALVAHRQSLSRLGREFLKFSFGYLSYERNSIRRSVSMAGWHGLRTGLKSRAATSRRNIFFEPSTTLERPYLYFPLQVDPEASTMVLSPYHTDQQNVIELLAKSVPPTMNVVVKEHFPMLGKRPKGFYERIQSLPGVQLLSPFANGRSLMEGAHAICSITGTATLEAILLQKPTIVIGGGAALLIGEGFVRCTDLSRLPEAIERAMEIPPVSEERLVRFVAAVLEVTFDFPAGLLWGRSEAVDSTRSEMAFQSLVQQVISVGMGPY